MAGKKGKSGPRAGQPTNNPNGRPVGSANKVGATTKQRIAQYIEEEGLDDLISGLKKLKAKDAAKVRLELIKLIVPRPISEEEADATGKLHSVFAHLFERGEGNDTK